MKHRYAIGLLTAVLMILLGWGGAALAADCGGATPCSCGDTVVAGRTLDPGVDPVCSPPACTGVGLFVASGVTLNLDGCTITGSNTAEGISILPTAANVTLIGGTITKFATGILATDASSVKITGTTVHSNAGGGIALMGAGGGHTIEQTIVRDNGTTGVSTGVVLEGDANTLTASRVQRHLGGGGVEFSGNNNVVSISRIELNNGPGVEFSGNGNTLKTSRVLTNVGDGVIFTGNDGLVTGNRVERNIGVGLELTGNGNTIDSNYFQYNEDDGIDLTGDNNLVRSNRVVYNGKRTSTVNMDADGIQLKASSNLNTIRGNNFNSNGGYGINDDSGHLDNIFRSNSCKSNGKGPSDPAGRC